MITWETAKMLAGLTIGFAAIAIATYGARYSACDSAVWEGFRIALSVSTCR